MLRSPYRNRDLATYLLCPLQTPTAQSLVLLKKGKTRAFAKCPPLFAGTLPLSRAVPPDPHGKTSSPRCPVIPSDPFASWSTQPTLSRCPLASQATHSTTRRSVRSGLKGRYSNLIRGPLLREKGSSFARNPLTPLARPGSIRPLSGTRLSYLPLSYGTLRLLWPFGIRFRLPRWQLALSRATSGV